MIKATSTAARRLLLVPIFLPAMLIFPLLDWLMGSWWGVLGVAAYVIGVFIWVQAPFRRRTPSSGRRSRRRVHPKAG